MSDRGTSLDLIGISHVGFSVSRLEQFIDTWGAALGITDWVIRNDVDEAGVEVAGVTQDLMRVRLGYARIAGVCLELVETVEGETCHAQSAVVTGPGLHHIAFWVENLDREVSKARDIGLRLVMAPSALAARLSGPVETATAGNPEAVTLYSFLDLAGAGLNFTLELLDMRLLEEYQRLTGERPTRPPGQGPSPQER